MTPIVSYQDLEKKLQKLKKEKAVQSKERTNHHANLQ